MKRFREVRTVFLRDYLYYARSRCVWLYLRAMVPVAAFSGEIDSCQSETSQEGGFSGFGEGAELMAGTHWPGDNLGQRLIGYFERKASGSGTTVPRVD